MLKRYLSHAALLTFILLLLLIPLKAQAYSTAAHIVLLDQIVKELPDNNIIKESIISNQAIARWGSEGPDLGFGQMGAAFDINEWADKGHYQYVGTFVKTMMQTALTEYNIAQTLDEKTQAKKRIAFAAGWITHIVGDLSCHGIYVNPLAGGVYLENENTKEMHKTLERLAEVYLWVNRSDYLESQYEFDTISDMLSPNLDSWVRQIYIDTCQTIYGYAPTSDEIYDWCDYYKIGVQVGGNIAYKYYGYNEAVAELDGISPQAGQKCLESFDAGKTHALELFSDISRGDYSNFSDAWNLDSSDKDGRTIGTLVVTIHTANEDLAGTDDDVFFSIRRKDSLTLKRWHLDKGGDIFNDFESNDTANYYLFTGSNFFSLYDIGSIMLEKSTDGITGGWKPDYIIVSIDGITVLDSRTSGYPISQWLEEDNLTWTSPLNIHNWAMTHDQILECDLNLSEPLYMAGHNLTIKKDMLLSTDLIMDGTLTVEGNFTHSNGILDINNQTLSINGDYRIQTPVEGAYGMISYEDSSGILKMTNQQDLLKINGNFIMQSNTSHSNYLSDGTVEVKGDFTQNIGNPYNFHTTSNFKLIFVDNPIHKILLGSSENTAAFLNYVSARNSEQIIFPNPVVFGASAQYIFPAETALFFQGGLTLNGDISIGGNVYFKNYLELNGHTLNISGSLIHDAATVTLNGGRITVGKDYRIQCEYRDPAGNISYSYTQNAILNMDNSNDYILVGGDFVLQNMEAADHFSAGILEVKGNFYQLSEGYGDFIATGTHKLILSGTGKQIIHMDNPDYSTLNELIIINSSLRSIEVQNALRVQKWLLDEDATLEGNFQMRSYVCDTTGSYTNGLINVNGKKLIINGNIDFYGGDMNLNGGILIVNGDLKFRGIGPASKLYIEKGNMTVNNLSLQFAGVIDLNEGILNVLEDYTQSWGLLLMNGGHLEVGRDYRFQEVYYNSDGTVDYFPSQDATLSMNRESDYILVHGNFIMQSMAPEIELTAGILEIKGNFTQLYATDNFNASGTHKVVLSGNGRQIIYFEYPELSKFNELSILNSSQRVIEIQNGLGVLKWNITEDVTLEGNFELHSYDPRFPDNQLGYIRLNGNKLSIYGNASLYINTLDIAYGILTVDGHLNVNCYGNGSRLLVSKGHLDAKGIKLGYSTSMDIGEGEVNILGNFVHEGNLIINGGRLTISGDYRMQEWSKLSDGSDVYQYTSSAALIMINPNDYILVIGNFIFESMSDAQQWGAGTLEVKGDFLKLDNSAYFTTADTHKIILSGANKQMVEFDNEYNSGNFGILEIRNSSAWGILFNTPVTVTRLFNHNNNSFTLYEGNNIIPDYDSDGIQDNLDQYPLVTENCIFTIHPPIISTKDGQKQVSISFQNNTVAEQNASMIIGVYKDNTLIDLVVDIKTFTSSESYDAFYAFAKVQSSEVYKIKVYIWNNLINMNPLGPIINGTIN